MSVHPRCTILLCVHPRCTILDSPGNVRRTWEIPRTATPGGIAACLPVFIRAIVYAHHPASRRTGAAEPGPHADPRGVLSTRDDSVGSAKHQHDDCDHALTANLHGRPADNAAEEHQQMLAGSISGDLPLPERCARTTKLRHDLGLECAGGCAGDRPRDLRHREAGGRVRERPDGAQVGCLRRYATRNAHITTGSCHPQYTPILI